MGGDDDFILIEDDVEEDNFQSTSIFQVQRRIWFSHTAENVPLNQRLSNLKKGLLNKMDAVKDRLKPRWLISKMRRCRGRRHVLTN